MLYSHWFYNDSASGTTRSYDVPANNAKYGLSKKLIIPYVFQTFRCFHANSMSRIVKIPVVPIACLTLLRIYKVEVDWFPLVLITFSEFIQICWFSNCWYFVGNINSFERIGNRNIGNVVISLVRTKKNLHEELTANTGQRRQAPPLLYNGPLEP